MENIKKVLTSIDWALLQKQKQQIIYLLNEPISTLQEPEHTALEGILNLIDAILDAVVEDDLISENTIFPEQEEDLEAEASAPIEQRCDSTVQGLTAIDLIPGKKYKCVYLPVNSGWRDKESHIHLNGIEFVSLYNAGSNFPAPEFISKETGNLITIDHDSKWEEVKEYPTEVNILGHIDTNQLPENIYPLINNVFSVRAKNCFRYRGIKSIPELINYSEKDLMRMVNFGKATLIEVKNVLKTYGCKLKDSE